MRIRQECCGCQHHNTYSGVFEHRKCFRAFYRISSHKDHPCYYNISLLCSSTLSSDRSCPRLLFCISSMNSSTFFIIKAVKETLLLQTVQAEHLSHDHLLDSETLLDIPNLTYDKCDVISFNYSVGEGINTSSPRLIVRILILNFFRISICKRLSEPVLRYFQFVDQ